MKLVVIINGKSRMREFAAIEVDGNTLFVDMTELRKSRSLDSVPLYAMDADNAISTGKCISAKALRMKGYY